MRIIPSSLIYEKVKEATKKANFVIEEDISKCLKKGCLNETNPLSKKVLEEMVDNIQIANDKHIPICQDTGIVVIFMEIGEDVFIEGSMINDINKAVKEAYLEEYLRCSVLNHPIERKNTFTNTPCIIHEKHVPGDKLKITSKLVQIWKTERDDDKLYVNLYAHSKGYICGRSDGSSDEALSGSIIEKIN